MLATYAVRKVLNLASGHVCVLPCCLQPIFASAGGFPRLLYIPGELDCTPLPVQHSQQLLSTAHSIRLLHGRPLIHLRLAPRLLLVQGTVTAHGVVGGDREGEAQGCGKWVEGGTGREAVPNAVGGRQIPSATQLKPLMLKSLVCPYPLCCSHRTPPFSSPSLPLSPRSPRVL